MNFTTLRPPPPSQVQRVTKQGEEKDAEFLLLRLLNKRSRVRLSPKPLPFGQGKNVLHAAANETNCFAVVTFNEGGQYGLAISPLSTLRAAFVTSESSEGPIPYIPQRSVPLPTTPCILTFARHGQFILVGLQDGQILTYDAGALLTGSGPDSPIHIFPSSGAPLRDILPNPEGIPDLVAVLYDTGGSPGSLAVQVLDVQGRQAVAGWQSGGSPDTTPSSISWSPKGKQLALGLLSGDIVSFSPTDSATIKLHVPPPSSLSSQMLISITWLTNSDFHVVFVPSGTLAPDSVQSHLILDIDSKTNTCTETQIAAPCSPFPGVCLPGSFPTILRQWDPTKFLIFIGDSCSSDIGLIGAESTGPDPHQQSWSKLSLEETSTPTVPLDEDFNDTVLMGLALDLTGTEPYRYKSVSGEDTEAPPPPVLYAYASDGTIVGWHVINTRNNPYPGMATATSAASAPQTSTMDTARVPAESVSQLQPAVFGQTAGPSSGFSQPTFAQPSAPAFGQGSFGQPPTLGQPSFGATAFGQTSFGGPPAASAFGAPKSGGFGSFAAGGPVNWGQTAPAFGTNNQLLSAHGLPSPMAVSKSASGGEPMAADNMSDAGLGGLSLGGNNDGMDITRPNTGRGVEGTFGSFSSTPSTTAASTVSSSSELLKPATGFGSSSFGSSDTSIFKPATGFGAFGGGASSTSAFGSGTSPFGSSGANALAPETTETKPATASPAFGSTGFGTPAAAPSFGQSSFGQSSFGKPSFGQSSFGSPGFGSDAPTTAPAVSPTKPTAFSSMSGGFGAFASGGTAAFSIAKKDEDGEEKSGEPAKPAFAAPATGGFSSFAQGGTTAFGVPKVEASDEPPKSVFGLAAGGGFSAFAQGGTSAFGLPKKEASPTDTAQQETAATSTSIFASASSPSPFTTPKPSPAEAVKVKTEEPQIPSLFSSSTPTAIGSTTPTAPPPALSRQQDRATTPPTPTSDPGDSRTASPGPISATPSKESGTTPASSPFANSLFKSTSPGPSTGAFANLSATKIEGGFGAFGGAGVNTSSPFFNPPKAPTATAFGTGAAGTSTTPKSVFGLSSTPSPTSVFGNTPADSTTPKSIFGTPSPLGSTAGGTVFGKTSWGTTPTTTPPAATKTETTVTSAFSAFSGSTSGLTAFSGGGESGKSFSDLLRSAKDSAAVPKVPAKPSEQEQEGDVREDSYEDETPYGEGEGDGEEDETSSFLSQSFSEESLPDEEQAEEEEGEEERPESPDRTPVKPAQPEEAPTPNIQLTSPSPPGTPASSSKGKLPSREESTTPPGSPVTKTSPPPSVPVAAPSPTTPAVNAPFGLGIGRPSTRPTRSSPLASAPISRSDEDETEPLPPTSKSAPPAMNPVVIQLEPAEQADSPPAASADDKPKAKTPPPPLPSVPAPAPALATAFGFGTPPTAAEPSKIPVPVGKGPIFPGPFAGFGQPKASTTPPAPGFSITPPPGATPTTAPTKGSIFSGGLAGFGDKSKQPPPPITTTTPPPTFPGFSLTPPSSSSSATTPAPTSVPTKGSIFSGGLAGFGSKPQSPASTPTPPSVPGATPSPSPTPASVFTPPPPAAVPGQSRSPTPAMPETPVIPPATLPIKLPPAPMSTPPMFGGFGSGGAGSLPPPFGPPKPLVTPSATPPPPSLPAAIGLPSAGLSFGSKVGGQGQGAFMVPSQAQAQALPEAAGPVPPKPQEALEGMQTVCLNIIMAANHELKMMKSLAEETAKKRAEYVKPLKVSRSRADINDPSKWTTTSGDVHEFARLMKDLEKEILELGECRRAHVKAIRELESGMLRLSTKKEEIARFSKASTDSDFARLVKVRTLGPEHLEIQTQLRRQIRVIGERIQTLEGHLESAKKRLNEFKTGKPAIRAPTLDTVNRTYRNIDLAISQQTDEIALLGDRISKLKLTESRRRGSAFPRGGSSERRMPEDSIFAPTSFSSSSPSSSRNGNQQIPIRDVTPDVAVTTAAALNSERAAQRLKRALLAVRKEPLLNTQAVNARSVPVEFKTPFKSEPSPPPLPAVASASSATIVKSKSPALNFDKLSFPSLFGLPSSPPKHVPVVPIILPPPPQTPATTMTTTTGWTLPPFNLDKTVTDSPDSPSPSVGIPSSRHRTHSTGKYHQRAVPFKKSPSATTAAAAAAAATVVAPTMGVGTSGAGMGTTTGVVGVTPAVQASPTPAPKGFDWGPLPGVKPKSTISLDVRKG